MKIADQIKETVSINGRGIVRLLDVMKEAEIPCEVVGFPDRRYSRPDGIALVCGHVSKPHEVILLDLGWRPSATTGHPDPQIQPVRVVSREPIPYVLAHMALYSYEKGKLRPWWPERKEVPALWPEGPKVLQVLGRGGDSEYLRVRLPHRSEEWLLPETAGMWMDRVPTKLELRLQEIWLDKPFGSEDRHPLRAVDHLLTQVRRERWFLNDEEDLYGLMACEEWEDLREDAGLSIDEALIAVHSGLISSIGEYGRTYFSGPFSGAAFERYIKAQWYRNESPEFMRQMADLHTIEIEMLRGAMRAVSHTRRIYARDAFDQLLK